MYQRVSDYTWLRRAVASIIHTHTHIYIYIYMYIHTYQWFLLESGEMTSEAVFAARHMSRTVGRINLDTSTDISSVLRGLLARSGVAIELSANFQTKIQERWGPLWDS